MKGKFGCKSKIIQTIVPKFNFKLKRKIKQERSSTPQRWSRRIRSLPPIPIKVLQPSHRKHEGKVYKRRTSSIGNCLNISEIFLKNALPKKVL